MKLLRLLALIHLALIPCYGLFAAESFESSIPNSTWVPIFFQEIDQTTDDINLMKLRETSIIGGSLEIRVWMGFGLTPLEGFIFNRTGENWKYFHIPPNFKRELISLKDPKSGVELFIKTLYDNEFFSLPDSSELINEKGIRDGVSYVVEIMQPNKYRTYMYSNPEYQDWAEAKQIISIINFIKSEFM